MGLKIYNGHQGKFVCDDDGGFGDLVAQVSIESQAPINSCAREGAAEPLLKKIGKMSQPQLFRCSQHCTADCRGNCNPANPPGFSTHERRNDGVAYSGAPRGGLLKPWQRGIDVRRDRVSAFIEAMHKRGYVVTLTYPGSVSESQHVNFRKAPKISLWRVRPLRSGMGGPRAREVIKLLRTIQEPGKRTPYLHHATKPKGKMTKGAVEAVARFQQDHHLKADHAGTVGEGTIHALRATAKRPPSRLDAAGIAFLVRQEGEVLHVYNDPSDFATYGVGHLLHRSPFTPADATMFGTLAHPKPHDQALALSRRLLDDDVARFERAVMKFVPERWRESHDRFNAFVSLAFNLGEEILTPEAPLRDVGLALRNKPDAAGVDKMVRAIMEFDKSAGKTLPGLEARRRDEANLIRRNK
jgi:GH24 family phage-related lysozyme (muramidase)